jgi:hypothetical protein
MRLPTQAKPVTRTGRRSNDAAESARIAAANPANCAAGVPNNIIGTCIFPAGPGDSFNCVACCAMRQALSWQGGGYAIAC